MPFALIVLGLMVIVTALNGTWKTGPGGKGNGLFPQLYQDIFTGGGGFLYWVAALVIVGFVGYIPNLRKPADAFMVLIVVAMLLKNGNVFSELQQGLQSGVGGTTAATTTGTSTGTTAPTTGLFSGPLGALLLNQQAATGAEPLTTETPSDLTQSLGTSGTVPLGYGGIGSA